MLVDKVLYSGLHGYNTAICVDACLCTLLTLAI